MNHFLVLDLRNADPVSDEVLSNIAERICSTSFADDLLVLENSSQADVKLRIFGADRREAEFCGNGMIYTAAKLGAELNRNELTIESASGIKQAVRQNEDWKIEVGPAIREEQEFANISKNYINDIPAYGLLRAGEPHLVLFRPKVFPGFHVNHKDFERFCQPLRDVTEIDGGVSITVVFQIEFRSALIRTYERGVRRQTFSCGTGSVAAIAALFDTPGNGSSFHICSPGGMHDITYENDRWYLKAAPQRIGTGYMQDTTIHLPTNDLFRYQ